MLTYYNDWRQHSRAFISITMGHLKGEGKLRQLLMFLKQIWHISQIWKRYCLFKIYNTNTIFSMKTFNDHWFDNALIMASLFKLRIVSLSIINLSGQMGSQSDKSFKSNQNQLVCHHYSSWWSSIQIRHVCRQCQEVSKRFMLTTCFENYVPSSRHSHHNSWFIQGMLIW